MKEFFRKLKLKRRYYKELNEIYQQYLEAMQFIADTIRNPEHQLNKLKAFEIIKEKPQTLHLISKCANYDDYLFIIDVYEYGYMYSKEEFNLLKEHLYIRK